MSDKPDASNEKETEQEVKVEDLPVNPPTESEIKGGIGVRSFYIDE